MATTKTVPDFVTTWYSGTDTLSTEKRRASVRVVFQTAHFAVFQRPGYSQGGDYAPAETVLCRKGQTSQENHSSRDAFVIEGRIAAAALGRLIESAMAQEAAVMAPRGGKAPEPEEAEPAAPEEETRQYVITTKEVHKVVRYVQAKSEEEARGVLRTGGDESAEANFIEFLDYWNDPSEWEVEVNE